MQDDLNSYENLNNYIDQRLIEWADWYAPRASDYGKGYPKRTIEHKIMTEGLFVIKITGKFYEPTNEKAEEVNEWMRKLFEYNPRFYEAVKMRYMSPRYVCVAEIARKNHIPVRTLEDRVRYAKIWLAGNISNINDQKKSEKKCGNYY